MTAKCYENYRLGRETAEGIWFVTQHIMLFLYLCRWPVNPLSELQRGVLVPFLMVSQYLSKRNLTVWVQDGYLKLPEACCTISRFAACLGSHIRVMQIHCLTCNRFKRGWCPTKLPIDLRDSITYASVVRSVSNAF